MNFTFLPPEINSALMYAGAGSGPMLAAASAWGGLSAELSTAAASFGSVISSLAAQSWQGPAAAAMGTAAERYIGFLGSAAVQADRAAGQASSTAVAYE